MRTEDGGKLKILTVLDEFTCESPAIELSRSIRARDVIEVLEYLFLVRGAMKFIRSDNGPEFIADAIARYADFMSIGTNDLPQYTMAAGRENPLVSSYFIDDHPAILKMIHMVIQRIGDKRVAVCGELAASYDAIPVLIEIGIRSLSVSPPLIPRVKEIIRQTKLTRNSVSN